MNEAESPTKSSYLQEWRKFRKMSQKDVLDKLAEMVGDFPRTGASLSRLENGRQPYSQDILEALAKIYDTRPGNLVDVNPLEARKVLSFTDSDGFRMLSEPLRKAILAMLEAGGET